MMYYRNRQLDFECHTWKRMLNFMSEENIHLKNRLTEVLGFERPVQILNEIEEYQNRFVQIDDLIRILRNDVAELEQFIAEKKEETPGINHKITNKLSRIRLNIPLVERRLERTKMSFNSFLLLSIKE